MGKAVTAIGGACAVYLTSRTSQVEDTTAKPEGCAKATACGDAIMTLVGDMV